MKTVTFKTEAIKDIIAFSKSNPWCITWSESLLFRFFSDLISSPNLVFDYFEGNDRVAVAVLIDKISNPCNDASLELLGMHSSVNIKSFLDGLIPLAQKCLPDSRSGFTFGFPATHQDLSELLERHQLKPHYEMFEMVRPILKNQSLDRELYERAAEGDDKDLYQTLKESFAQNVDTSIPTLEDWLEGRRRNEKRVTWIQKVEGKIVAFLNLNLEDEVPEISTLGVLPEYRGKGHGKRLIQTALFFLRDRKCKLSVAVKNKKALDLYLSQGFAICDHHMVNRWGRV